MNVAAFKSILLVCRNDHHTPIWLRELLRKLPRELLRELLGELLRELLGELLRGLLREQQEPTLFWNTVRKSY